MLRRRNLRAALFLLHLPWRNASTAISSSVLALVVDSVVQQVALLASPHRMSTRALQASEAALRGILNRKLPSLQLAAQPKALQLGRLRALLVPIETRAWTWVRFSLTPRRRSRLGARGG